MGLALQLLLVLLMGMWEWRMVVLTAGGHPALP